MMTAGPTRLRLFVSEKLGLSRLLEMPSSARAAKD